MYIIFSALYKIAHVLISLIFPFFFHKVAKAGCSAWKGIIIDNALNQKRDARTDVKGIHSRTIMDQSNISMVGSWKPEFDSYTKILFVRHPFDRVISAFYNLKHFKEGARMHGPGRHIRHEVKRMFDLESLAQLEFTDFVRFITNKSLEDPFYYDRHFNSFAQTCRVCDVKYDKILKIESMRHDSFPILKDMGFSDEYIDSMQKSDNTRPGVIPRSTLHSNKVLNELKHLNTKYYWMLLDRYKFDFQMFGYGINMHSNVASCRIRMGNEECC